MSNGLRTTLSSAVMCLLLALTAAVSGCGSSGEPSPAAPGGVSGAASAVPGAVDKGTGAVQLREDQIGSLPSWQRELLSDPGWNQPYIAPRAGTPTQAPPLDSLLAETAAAMARGRSLHPRYAQDTGKGASWYGDSSGPFADPIAAGEYETLPPAGEPPFGCNSDASNASPGSPQHAIEDLIEYTAYHNSMPAYKLSYVREGLCAVNYFNSLAGANKNESAAVYQAFCSQNSGGFDPINPPMDAQVAEISYRSSLVPDGNPGGTCNATAYAVKDYFWRAFNGQLEAIPGGPVELYNVLIAPAGEVSASEVSDGDTTGWYQPFYFGNMSACYGGAWIIGLKASNSRCDTFRDYFDQGSGSYVEPGFWYRPIYGVLLQRWLDLAPVAGVPWAGALGWPVYGPIGYANGALQLNGSGAYYLWGFWFERGFIWWVDYDQAAYPGVPDEAQAFRFTGDNVYCLDPGDELIRIAPTTFYGGQGPLGVSVSVDAFRNSPADPWEPVAQNQEATEYHVALPADDGLATVTLKLHAQGYGGTPNEDCLYKTYVWAFRDGTIQAAGTPYSNAQKRAIHTYGDLVINKESTYVVRVQVQDEVGFAYGDSLPIVLGHGGGAGCGQIMVIRDDAPSYSQYNTNFNALLADLDQIGALYTVVHFRSTIAADFAAQGYDTAIWYRGGPGAVGEPDYTTDWTADEEAQFNLLLRYNMLLISQAHSSMDRAGSDWDSFCNYWGWDNDPDSQFCQHLDSSPMTHATDQNMGLTSNEFNGVFGWLSVMMASDMGKGEPNTRGPQLLGLPGAWSNNAAERNLRVGSSGKVPIKLSWATGGTDVLQFCCRGWYPPFGPSWINPGWTQGLQANPTGSGGWDDGNYGAANLSYGNTSSGGVTWQAPGPGRFWCWGMPYAKLAVTESAPSGMTRAEVLQNVLSWLDDSLSLGYGSAGGGEAYHGSPEIVSVMPGYWTTSPPNFVRGQFVQPGISYPDATGTDVYKTNYTNLIGERYVSTAMAGNDGMNTNDIDFQFPWYAYITTTNGAVETSPDDTVVPPALSTDDTFMIRGLLVSDADTNWSRYAPPAGELPNCLLNAGPLTPVVAGYFSSVSGISGDETFATYGTGAPALSWDNSYTLECESIAHWPDSLVYGSRPAALYWSMFPGHNMYLPGTVSYLTDSSEGWDAFRRIFDIDPTASPAGRDTSTWNAARFTYTSIIADGRVVQYNYRNIRGWNPDLNRDNDANAAQDAAADKFPIRCRLFTDYSTYIDSDPGTPGVQPYTWPDNEPPMASYFEAGCYVTDTGSPVVPFVILDDPDAADPMASVTGTTGNYDVTFNFILRHGTNQAAGYDVQFEFDPTFDRTFGDLGAYVRPTTAVHYDTNGVKTYTLHITDIPDGMYWIGMQGIDQGDDPPQSSTYFYTEAPLALNPP